MTTICRTRMNHHPTQLILITILLKLTLYLTQLLNILTPSSILPSITLTISPQIQTIRKLTIIIQFNLSINFIIILKPLQRNNQILRHLLNSNQLLCPNLPITSLTIILILTIQHLPTNQTLKTLT